MTDQLGLQVRHAVEILIQMIDRADQDSGDQNRGGRLLGKDVPPDLLYEAALTVMMRLVFMLSAEERKLLPLDDALYAEYYAVSTLRAQLSELADQQGEEVLERRFDAWSRLLAVFRAVYGGIRHERLTLPPYGGSLFDPDKYPFLEGRPFTQTLSQRERGLEPSPHRRGQDEGGSGMGVAPLPINNRTVLHLLDALQMLQVSGEARRLSFRALDVEQIGHVYEGLLDHHAVRAAEVMVGLRGAKRQEPEVPLAALELAAKKKAPDFIAWLNEQTGRTPSALKNALDSSLLHDDADFANRLRAAAGNDEALFKRLAPFAGLLRSDDFGFPVIILPGSVYVTQGTARRATGTHYTPRSLTEPVVQHTLEPLVYVGPAEGLPKEQWRLRSPDELLALKVCDMAMGSGGFLVQVIRYLAERLVESWEIQEEQAADSAGHSSPTSSFILPPSSLSTDDRLTYARRLVAERCVYGVDKNPLAVEIAKLSLWLVTLAKDLPFTFLDHALKCGDSLVGASEADFKSWARGWQAAEATLFDEQLEQQLGTARQKRRDLESFVVRDVQDAERKTGLLQEAEAAMSKIKRGCDLLTGSRLLGLKAQEVEDLQINLLMPYIAGKLDGEIDAAKHLDADRALAAARKESAFHWGFEFPEVFEMGGFSAFVGNPPFMGGVKITPAYGYEYTGYLKEWNPSSQQNTDIAAYFFLRAFNLLCNSGFAGLIGTNSIGQTDTRLGGLEVITKHSGEIIRSYPSLPWPGSASLSISVVYITKGSWKGDKLLDDKSVNKISSFLDNEGEDEKHYLQETSNLGYVGAKPYGEGFVLLPDEITYFAKKYPDIIKPYLNGKDLMSNVCGEPLRWIIDFGERSLAEAKQYGECLKILERRVKPERDLSKNNCHRDKWWLFGYRPNALYRKLKQYAWVCAQTSKYLAWERYLSDTVFDQKLIVVALEGFAPFSVLQSCFHKKWALRYGSTLETRPVYIPTECLATFPFPKKLTGLEQIGETYHETRRQIMLTRQEGLTATYNRFHNPQESASDIIRLRELHVELDNAVAAAYGWQDLELGHGFHQTAQGVRFTISEAARREVLSRLLKLNHERYEEEVRQGLHEKKTAKGAKKKGRKVKEEKGQYELF